MSRTDDILQKLSQAVAKENVKTDPETIAFYSQDQSFNRRRNAFYVVFPQKTSEVQAVVRLANEYRMPIVPRSSRVSLHGASIPAESVIIIDLSLMNRILEVNERNWYAIIEPGVTFLQLHEHLAQYGFRVASPLLDPPSASVVSSYMERNPVVTAADFTYGAEHVMSYTVVSPIGEVLTVGHPPLENTPASAPDGPGLNFYRIFQGAQGTLGIVTWMVIRVLPQPHAQRVFFFPCGSAEQAVSLIQRVQQRELGLECFALNNFNMASLLFEESSERTQLLRQGKFIGNRGAPRWTKAQLRQFSELKNKVPPWTVVLRLTGVGPIPEEKVAYQELDLKEVAADFGIAPQRSLNGIANSATIMAQELLLPWRMQQRYSFRGSVHQLMFYSTPQQVSACDTKVGDMAQKFHYPAADIGGYLLPLERARAFFCSYDLHCNLENSDETHQVSQFFDELSEVLLEEGAFFDRPYGKWAQMVFDRAGTYTEYLKSIKHSLDPNNIMNPGKILA